MSDLHVDPAEVLRTAARLADQADRVRERAGRMTSLEGTRRSAGYRQALDEMGGRLSRHAAELDTLAGRLRDAAHGYRRTESDAVAGFREIADDLG